MARISSIIVSVLVVILLMNRVDAECVFPTAWHGTDWTNTDTTIGAITFGVSYMLFTDSYVDQSQNTVALTNWTCHVNDSLKIVVRSAFTHLQFGSAAYFYYCFDFTMQNSFSYTYYLQTVLDSNNKRRAVLSTAFSGDIFTTVCAETRDSPDYSVIIRTGFETSTTQVCAVPLLGSFFYTYSDGTDRCGSTPGTGILDLCDSSAGQTTLTANYTTCTQEVAHSSAGVVNCIANLSVTASGVTTYYQTLYDHSAATDKFTCWVLTTVATSTGTNSTVSVSQKATMCDETQTSTAMPTGGALLVLSSYQLCGTDAVVIEPSAADNTALIVAIAVSLLLVLIIVIIILLLYFCYFKKDPNAGKPIVENTKPRFEDPDKEDVLDILDLEDARSTPVTRDDIAFEAGSPSYMPNTLMNTMSTSVPNGTTSPRRDNSMGNGSLLRDSGIALTDRSSERPFPRAGLNPSRETMVIFNGDEKVISGNDTRVIPNENPNLRTLMRAENAGTDGPLTLMGLEGDEYGDTLGELSPHDREEYPYPSLPREKSNLMPPIETVNTAK